MTRVGDDTYMYCPCIARSLGDPEDTWYLVPADSTRMAQLPLAGQEVLPLALDWVDFAGMEPRGEQPVAGQVCTVYGGTRDDAVAVIDGLLSAMSPEGSMFGSLLGDQALSHVDMTLSVCPDGHLRQIDVSLSGDLLQMGQQLSVTANLMVQTPPPDMTITAPAVFKPYPADKGGAGTATVYNGGNIRAKPDLNGEVYGQLHAGETVTVVSKTPDGRWYFVNAPEANGWVSVTLLTLDPEVVAAVPVYEAEDEELVSGGPTATVFNGGNVREMPSVDGPVLDQIHAFEQVVLLSRTADGLWWKIRNPRGITGWVHRSLLTISDGAAQTVPVE